MLGCGVCATVADAETFSATAEGKTFAITATARKLAILVYRVLKGEIDYADPGASAYDEQHRERTLRNVRSRAKRLGFGLVVLETGELLQGAAS